MFPSSGVSQLLTARPQHAANQAAESLPLGGFQHHPLAGPHQPPDWEVGGGAGLQAADRPTEALGPVQLALGFSLETEPDPGSLYRT